MKTETKSQIIEIIRKNGKVRPSDLASQIGISPQAVHRHLKSLVSSGILESRGAPPTTAYVLADVPDFSQGLNWFSAKTAKSVPDVCETRDQFAARLARFKQYDLTYETQALIISTSGEIGNNSFDHNIGQWKDIPGCWFEIQKTRNRLWVLIADRGQGIYHSIFRVMPNLRDEASAVKRVFEEHISGRAPEKRGNGLKFVKKSITDSPGRGIACCSGKGSVCYGEFGENCLEILKSAPMQDFGTVTLTIWTHS